MEISNFVPVVGYFYLQTISKLDN